MSSSNSMKQAQPLAQDYAVVYHNTKAARRGLDGPGMVKMPDGTITAVVPVKLESEWVCEILQSQDNGQQWKRVSQLAYYSAVPWEYQGVLYLFAHPESPKFRNGDLQLLCSENGGRTWSEPVTLFQGHYWNCQTSMAVRHNRLYWAVDDMSVGGDRRGPRVVSVDLDAPLMDPGSWRLSNLVEFPGLPESLLHPGMTGTYPSQRMLEPNVICVNGKLRVLAAVKPLLQATTGLCAVFDISDDGSNLTLSFTQFHPMPGGQLKFSIVWDDVSTLFWAGVNLAVDGQDQLGFKAEPPEMKRDGSGPPNSAIGGNDRRFLMLYYGLDGLNWFPAGCIARAGKLSQSFNYPTLVIDNDDLIVIARTSIHSHSRHDADFATFHRIRNFRQLALNLRQD